MKTNSIILGFLIALSIGATWKIIEQSGDTITLKKVDDTPEPQPVPANLAKPMKLISRNVPVFASTGNAKLANDDSYDTEWRSTTVPSVDAPTWLAFNISQHGIVDKALLVWYNRANYNYDYTRFNDGSTYNLPSNYVIQCHKGIDKVPPTTDWIDLKTIEQNTLKSRSDLVNSFGCNWLRVLFTKGSDRNDSQNRNVSLNLDIYSIDSDGNDRLLILGDSITAGSLQSGTVSKPVFDKTGNFPAIENGGIGGTHTTHIVATKEGSALSWLHHWLIGSQAKFVAFAYGTNDAGYNIDLGLFKSNLEKMISTALEMGITPILPSIIWSPNSPYDDIPKYNEVIENVLKSNPKAVKGPDLYLTFKDKPTLLRDGIHPNNDGISLLRSTWADWIVKLYQSSDVPPTDPSDDSDDTPTNPVCPPCPTCNDEASNTMKVKGRDLFDSCGEKVVLRGINEMVVWENYQTPRDGLPSFTEIAKTGANSVRIVWSIDNKNTSEIDTVLKNAIDRGLIPIIELHDQTCKWSKEGFESILNFWLDAEVVSVLNKYSKWVIVNFGNEIGGWGVSQSEYISFYSSAIKQMRLVGLNMPIMIDGSECGQSIDMLQASAKSLIEADPLKNILFSVHMWWTSDDSADRVRHEIKESVDMGLPLVIGEFASKGADSCLKDVPYKTIIEEAEKNSIHYFVWSWGMPRNAYCSEHDMAVDSNNDGISSYDDLLTTTNRWSYDLVVSSPYGIKQTSKKTSLMLTGKCKG